MLKLFDLIFIFIYISPKCLSANQAGVITTKAFMFWQNATVPFYINPDHFDHEQAMAIMTSLSMFAFKTCLKFAPVMAVPEENQHVMVFINPEGIRRCRIQTTSHSNFHPHLVLLGYDCLQSPDLDMIIMRALGFSFEHNRMSRDVYIDVMIENIEPSSMNLFAKDTVLPPALRALPYDINSVMHFRERDYSKNGHRTIIFKNHNLRQNRNGLSPTDLRKIELIYGPECRQRDRQEKIELCQSYPGVARRKREIQPSANKSLRVNPDITPPSSSIPTTLPEEQEVPEKYQPVEEALKKLGVADEAENIMDRVYKLSALAITNARDKYCNNTNSSNFDFNIEKPIKKERSNRSDLLDILQTIAEYAQTVVENAAGNLTVFCQNSESIEFYQRQKKCSWSFGNNCPINYRSTKSGAVRYSTQHRPIYAQSTKHERQQKYSYDKPAFRAGNNTASMEITTASISRRKREASSANTPNTTEESHHKEKKKEKKILKEKVKMMYKEKMVNDKVNLTNTLKMGNDKVNLTNTLKMGAPSNGSNDKVPRRYFQERRYKVKNPPDESENDWEGSDISIDKEEQKAKEKKDKLEKKEQKIQAQKGRERQKERKKEKDIATDDEKETEQEEIVRGKPNKEAESKEVMDLSVEDVKTIEEDKKDSEKSSDEDNDDEKGIEIDKELAVELQKEIEEEAEAEEEESETETTTEKKKRRKVKEIKKKEVLEFKIEKPKEKEVRLDNKARDHMKKRKRSHSGVPKTVNLNKLNEEFYNERRWPDGVVIYVIKHIREYDLEDLRNRLAEVNSILKRKTCVKLREVDAKEAEGFEDYLVLDNSPDYVTGRVGGKQIFGCVELFQGSQHVQHTAMMVMAMLGFYFEVSRHDRDKYIRVHNRHVRPDKLHHFEKIREEATLDLPYDYKSATHPAWQFWRKIGKTGISTVATYKEQDPDGSVMRSLGQNPELLSEYDIIKINSVYGVDCFKNGKEKEEEEKEEEEEEEQEDDRRYHRSKSRN